MLNLRFIAFVNAEWLTPDEREPPACSSTAVESIGGILGEGGIAICCICYHLTLPICLFFVIYYQFLAISCDIPLWWKGRTWTLAWCGGCHSWGRAPAWYIPWLAIRCPWPGMCDRRHHIWMLLFLYAYLFFGCKYTINNNSCQVHNSSLNTN